MEIILGVRKGAWSKQEDDLLRACIQRYGEGKWHLVPQRAGLNRCRKSCRLRWMNYLKPDIKRGNFTEDEADMIMRFHRLLGNRWSLIAGRLPGRTSNDVKNYWNTHMRKKLQHHSSQNDEKQEATMKTHQVIRPQSLTFSRKSSRLRRKPVGAIINNDGDDNSNRGKPIIAINNNNNYSRSSDKAPCAASAGGSEKSREWWESLLDDVKEVDEEDSLWCLGGEKQEKLLTYLWDEQLDFLNDPETQ